MVTCLATTDVSSTTATVEIEIHTEPLACVEIRPNTVLMFVFLEQLKVGIEYVEGCIMFGLSVPLTKIRSLLVHTGTVARNEREHYRNNREHGFSRGI